MVKLNKKGYLAVEVILASVVAVSIAVFLIDLTVKMVNKTNDNYTNTLFLTDKALITNNLRKEIKKDIEKEKNGPIQRADFNGKYTCNLKFTGGNTSNITIGGNEITYQSDREKKYSKTINKDITVAVMGCAVNGPEEAKHADIGIAGGVKEGLLFKKGEIVRKVKQEEIVKVLKEEIMKL